MASPIFFYKFFIAIIFCIKFAHCFDRGIFSLKSLQNLSNFDLSSVKNLPEKFDDISLPDIGNLICGDLGSKDITPECRRQMNVVCSNPGILLQMADAWSKYPYSGLAVRTRLDLGTFDQCVDIDFTEDSVRVLGKHCTAGILIPTTVIPSQILDTAYYLSYCAPSSCNAVDVFRLVGVIPVQQLVNDAICTTKEDNSKIEGRSKIVLIVFMSFFAIIVQSTIYDVTLYALQKAPMVKNGDKEQIMAFHGLKLISMLWIVSGHVAVTWEFIPVVNDAQVKNWISLRYSQYIASAHLAVDTFFFISGFLMAYQYFKKEAYKPIVVQMKNIPLLIFQRYLRLTPALLMVYLFMIGLAKYFMYGPLGPYERGLTQPCLDNWYAVFLYIQNYYNRNDLCLTSLWYVSADMQLFLFAPIIMIPIAFIVQKKLFKTALTLLFMANLIFLGLPIFTKLMFRNYDPDYDEYDTHSRLIDYFIGFTFGFYIRHKKDKPFIFDLWMNIFLWILALGGMLGALLVLHEINMNHGYVAKALCYSFMRPVWCLGLCWIIYSCINGKAGAVNSILSNGFMQVGGKLTYTMYLVHSIIIMQWTLSTRTARHFSDLEMFYLSCGIFVMTWVIATIWSLSFESPIIIITRILMGGGGKKTPRAPQTNGHLKTSHSYDISPPPPAPLS